MPFRLSDLKRAGFLAPIDRRPGCLDPLLSFSEFSWNAKTLCQHAPDLATAGGKAHASFAAWYNHEARCYPFALGDRTLFLQRISGDAELGVLSGVEERLAITGASAQEMIDLAEQDGLISTGTILRLDGNSRPVALFVADNRDYHWLRLDRLDTNDRLAWTHKFAHRHPKIYTPPHNVIDIRNVTLSSAPGLNYHFASFFNVPCDLAIKTDLVDAYRQHNAAPVLTQAEKKALAKARHGRYVLPQLG